MGYRGRWGAVSIEAARLSGFRVFAVERDEGQLRLIRQNCALLGLPTLAIVGEEAPQALASLPAPDRVFIGGSGGKLCGIVDVVQAQDGRRHRRRRCGNAGDIA